MFDLQAVWKSDNDHDVDSLKALEFLVQVLS